MDEWWLPIITGGLFAVDAFFFMSAFLATYIMIQKLKKVRNFGPGTVLGIYFHRVFRLLPTIALLMLLVVAIWQFMGDGPVWNFVVGSIHENCR